MGTYLARWGFTAQKSLRRAYEQEPTAARRRLRQDYPAIAARAKAEGGTIFWGDETGLRSDDIRGRSYVPQGRTPEATHAPYANSIQAPSDVIGGRVDVIWDYPLTAMPHVREGRLRALAVTNYVRVHLAPDVPTVAECGFAEAELLP